MRLVDAQLLLALLSVQLVQAGGSQSNSTVHGRLVDFAPPSEWKSCLKDLDCVIVQTRCSTCGKVDGLNKKYEQDFIRLMNEKCGSGNFLNCGKMPGELRCIQSVCRYFPEG